MMSLRAATEGQLKRALAADTPQLWRALRAKGEDDARYWIVDAESARTADGAVVAASQSQSLKLGS